MAEGVSIQLQGHDELLSRLAHAAAALGDLTPLLEDIGAEIERRARLRFETKTDPAGIKWDELAESTKAKYAREDKVAARGTLLERTGRMRASLAFNVVGDNSVEVGFGKPYAIWHETGTKHMPRRGMLLGSVSADGSSGELAADDAAAILSIIDDHIGGALGA